MFFLPACPKHTPGTSPYHHHHHHHHHEPQLVKQFSVPATSEPNTSTSHSRGLCLTPVDPACQTSSSSVNLNCNWRPIAPAPDPDLLQIQPRQQQQQHFAAQPAGMVGGVESTLSATANTWSGRFLQPVKDGTVTTMILTTPEGTSIPTSGNTNATMVRYKTSGIPITASPSQPIQLNESSLRTSGKRTHSAHTYRTPKHGSPRRWPLFQPNNQPTGQTDSNGSVASNATGESGLSRPAVDLSDLVRRVQSSEQFPFASIPILIVKLSLSNR